MSTFDDFDQDAEAILEYGDADYDVVKPGGYVVCAVTGVRVPLRALRYWSVDKQEAYADAAAAMKGMYAEGAAR